MKLSDLFNTITTAVLLLGVGGDLMMQRVGAVLAVMHLTGNACPYCCEMTLGFFVYNMHGAGMLTMPKDFVGSLMTSNLFLGGFCCIYNALAARVKQIPNPNIF